MTTLSPSEPGSRISVFADTTRHYLRDLVYGANDGIVTTFAVVTGVTGAHAVQATGGVVIAQDPQTADHPGMPSAAIATGAVGHVFSADQIAPALLRLATRNAPAAHLPAHTA